MKKIILTAGLILSIHIITKAQSLTAVNTGAQVSPGRQLNELPYSLKKRQQQQEPK